MRRFKAISIRKTMKLLKRLMFRLSPGQKIHSSKESPHAEGTTQICSVIGSRRKKWKSKEKTYSSLKMLLNLQCFWCRQFHLKILETLGLHSGTINQWVLHYILKRPMSFIQWTTPVFQTMWQIWIQCVLQILTMALLSKPISMTIKDYWYRN